MTRWKWGAPADGWPAFDEEGKRQRPRDVLERALCEDENVPATRAAAQELKASLGPEPELPFGEDYREIGGEA